MNNIFYKSYFILTLCLISSLPYLCGCAKKYSDTTPQIKYYEACYRPVADLKNKEENKEGPSSDQIFNGILGGIGGLVVGGIASFASFNPSYVVALPVYGIAGGGFGSNIYMKMKYYTDDETRLKKYSSNLDDLTNEVAIVVEAVNSSGSCYSNALNKILDDIQINNVAKLTNQEKIEEINSGFRELINFLGIYENYLKDLYSQYTEAFKQESSYLLNPKIYTNSKESINTYNDRVKNKERNNNLINIAMEKSKYFPANIQKIRDERNRVLNETSKLSLLIE